MRSRSARSSRDAPRDARDQAVRYLADGRLTVAYVDGTYVAAVCQADEGVQNLGFEIERGWWCSCEQGPECAHLTALKLVTASAVRVAPSEPAPVAPPPAGPSTGHGSDAGPADHAAPASSALADDAMSRARETGSTSEPGFESAFAGETEAVAGFGSTVDDAALDARETPEEPPTPVGDRPLVRDVPVEETIVHEPPVEDGRAESAAPALASDDSFSVGFLGEWDVAELDDVPGGYGYAEDFDTETGAPYMADAAASDVAASAPVSPAALTDDDVTTVVDDASSPAATDPADGDAASTLSGQAWLETAASLHDEYEPVGWPPPIRDPRPAAADAAPVEGPVQSEPAPPAPNGHDALAASNGRPAEAGALAASAASADLLPAGPSRATEPAPPPARAAASTRPISRPGLERRGERAATVSEMFVGQPSRGGGGRGRTALIVVVLLIVVGLLAVWAATALNGSKPAASRGPSAPPVVTPPPTPPPPPASPSPSTSPSAAPAPTTFSATFPAAASGTGATLDVTALPSHDPDCLTNLIAGHAAYQSDCRAWASRAPGAYWFFVTIQNRTGSSMAFSLSSFSIVAGNGSATHAVNLGARSSNPSDFLPAHGHVAPHDHVSGWLNFVPSGAPVPAKLVFARGGKSIVVVFSGTHVVHARG